MINGEPGKLERLSQSGFSLEYLEQIDSTNLELIRRSKAGAKPGLVLVADFQTQGRGRLGRSWEAKPKSSLLVSVLVKPEVEPEALGLVPIVSGVALAMAIEEVSGFKPGLVWPNDLFGKKGKMAGVLVESVFEQEELKAVVIGAGVNLWQKKEDFPPELQNRASSIFLETGKMLSRDQLLFPYLEQLDFWMKRLEQEEFLRIVEKYSEFDIIKGKEVRVMRNGGEIFGIGLGIDKKGRLKLWSGEKELCFSVGEIVMVRREKDVVSD